MNSRQVDVAIIGTGTAGMGAYREARKHTDSIALIEAEHYGTTCARVGCMPSKLLIAAADAAHHVQHSGRFGVHASELHIDGQAVLERVRQERDRFVGFVVSDVEGFDEQHKIKGFARFKDAHTLLVNDTLEIHAKRIVIATGSRPFVPEVLKGAEDRLLSNDDIFELADIPKSVLVAGTGVIGLELGQALSRLGTQVTMLARGESLGGIQDEEMRAYATEEFATQFDLHMQSSIEDVRRTDSGVGVRYINAQGETQDLEVDYVLAATGRVANVDKLDLENTSLELDGRGAPIFDAQTMQTSVPTIFIAGDANSDLPLLHEASDEGRIAGRNAGAYPFIEKGHRRTPLAVVFSDPQIASVGQVGRQIDRANVVVGKVSFESQGRSRVMGVNRGMLKVYAERGSGRFIGAEMFGPAAEHIGHLLSWSVQQGLTVDEILEMPFYHPVIEEGVRTAFRNAKSELEREAEVRYAAHQ